MTDNEKTEQRFRSIRMSNRVTVAEIKLKRANKLSDISGRDMKEICEGIDSLADGLLIGDDVRTNLDMIEKRVDALEAGIY